MKGFFFLLLTTSILLMIQVQAASTNHTTRRTPTKSGTPALSGLGSGSALLLLTSTLIHLFHFS
ncbi:CAMPATH-1 antigen-like [Trichechus manatus latirostris]|uniref:CAMPATH-1 antigen n=1 Tax=Trichechus manatus latirostris TaxID=127582 RepID=A0A2Y9FX01_TRIMA|nr:CAMPATH-1 antigen-like [Trichechus manatus latirostris]